MNKVIACDILIIKMYFPQIISGSLNFTTPNNVGKWFVLFINTLHHLIERNWNWYSASRRLDLGQHHDKGNHHLLNIILL